MREIKFRAWNIEKGEFFAPTYEAYKGNLFDISVCMAGLVIERTIEQPCSMVNHENWELMQYTGLKDKNGVEIYEGDIVNDKFDCDQLRLILWDDVNACFSAECHFRDNRVHTFSLSTDISTTVEGVVVGNIHENPELLDA